MDSTNFWVGLYDRVTEGTFVWGSGRDLSIKHWNSGQPNNYKGNEDCARFYNGGLDDHSCKDDTAEVVCQKGRLNSFPNRIRGINVYVNFTFRFIQECW